MKTTTKVFALAILGTLALTSCKKSYTCDCAVDGTYYIHYDYTNMSEESATATCAADELLAQQESGQNVQCSIK